MDFSAATEQHKIENCGQQLWEQQLITHYYKLFTSGIQGKLFTHGMPVVQGSSACSKRISGCQSCFHSSVHSGQFCPGSNCRVHVRRYKTFLFCRDFICRSSL